MRLYLCSSQADETSPGKYVFRIGPGIKTGRIDIEFVNLPLSWLAFSNETFYLNEGGATLTCNLNGSYDSTTFPAYLKQQLEAVSALTYTVTIDAGTNALSILGTGNFEIEWTKFSDRARYMLGGDTTDTGLATSWTGDDSLDLGGDACVYLSSNIFGGQSFSNNQLRGVMVPIAANPGNYTYWVPERGTLLGQNDTSSVIELEIRDIWGNLLDLRGKTLAVAMDVSTC